MTTAVVCNPAKVDDPQALRVAVRERAGADPIWLETTEDDPGAGQTKEALARGADLVLVCGGDGTVAACAGALADSGAAMALIPSGTGNLLARNLGLPLDRDGALDIAFSPGRRTIDLLEADGTRFAVMAGLGFDAAMIRDTDEHAKARIGWLAYVAGGARALRRTARARYEIQIDSGEVLHRRAIGVLIGNVGRLQGGIAVLPDAEPDDGQLDVVVLTPRTWRDLPALALRLVVRRRRDDQHAQTLRGRTVRVRADRVVPVEYDGDHVGETDTLTVSVLERTLVVCTG